MYKVIISLFITLSTLCTLNITWVAAQNKFEPIVTVNNLIISHYELSQRVLLINILQTNKPRTDQILDSLINERLIEEFSNKNNLSISNEVIEIELSNLAKQFNLTKEAFLLELERLNISEQTIRTFVKNRNLLNEVVYFKFASRADISNDEIDSYIINGSATVELKLSEIVLPFSQDDKAEKLDLIRSIKNKLSEGRSFSSIAMEFSKSPTATNGGLIGWVPIEQIPEELGNKLLLTKKNEIVGPEILANIVILYQLLDIRSIPLFPNVNVELDFLEMEYPIESDINLEQTILLFQDNDNCLNLQFELKKYPELNNNLNRQVVNINEIETKKLEHLRKLDAGELVIIKSNSQSKTITLMMLCSRQQKISETDRELAKQYLISKRLNFLADGFLADLRSDSRITYK